jgi:hypothetical protein
MNDLFLSYASEDRDKLVRPVADELRRRGLSVWVDEGEIVPGIDFITAIQSGMKSAHAMVLLVSRVCGLTFAAIIETVVRF